VLAVALSLLVEGYQAALTTRVGAFADVVANGLGALLGAAVATLLLAVPAVRSAGRARVQPGR
jgi:VanZ family protein